MNRKFYATPDEAIQSAKKRAKSTYMTQYIYQQESGLYVRNTLVESEGPVMKVLFDGTVVQLKAVNESMNEQEIKDTVEKIVQFEKQADDLMEHENFTEASACNEAAYLLEEELEQQGYFLGESGEDIVVYHADCFKTVKDEWMRFDRAEGKWRKSNESN